MRKPQWKAISNVNSCTCCQMSKLLMWNEWRQGLVSLLYQCGRLKTVPLLVTWACWSDPGSPEGGRSPAWHWWSSYSRTPSPPSALSRGRSPWSSVWSFHPEMRRAPGWGCCLCSPGQRRRSRRPWWRWSRAHSPAPWPGWRCGWASSTPRTQPPPPPPAAWSAAGCDLSRESLTASARSLASAPWVCSTGWWWARARQRQRQTHTPSWLYPSTRTARGTARHTRWCLQGWEGEKERQRKDDVYLVRKDTFFFKK